MLEENKKKPIIKYLSHYPRPQSSTLHGPLAGFLPTQIFIALIIHTKFYFQQYCRVGSGFFLYRGSRSQIFFRLLKPFIKAFEAGTQEIPKGSVVEPEPPFSPGAGKRGGSGSSSSSDLQKYLPVPI